MIRYWHEPPKNLHSTALSALKRFGSRLPYCARTYLLCYEARGGIRGRSWVMITALALHGIGRSEKISDKRANYSANGGTTDANAAGARHGWDDTAWRMASQRRQFFCAVRSTIQFMQFLQRRIIFLMIGERSRCRTRHCFVTSFMRYLPNCWIPAVNVVGYLNGGWAWFSSCISRQSALARRVPRQLLLPCLHCLAFGCAFCSEVQHACGHGILDRINLNRLLCRTGHLAQERSQCNVFHKS